MTPDKIIWALMLFVVVPSAFVNRAAVVTLFVFMLGYLGWRLHMPEPETQLWLYAMGLGAGFFTSRGMAQQVATAMFLPLGGTMVAWIYGGLTNVEAWNAALWLTLMQIVAVPFGNDWTAIGAFIRKATRATPTGRMEMTLGPAR